MSKILKYILAPVIIFFYFQALSQEFVTKAPPGKRLQVLWRFCTENFISDGDSAATLRFFSTVANTADSLGDPQLKAYADYFRMCYLIPFSENHERHYPKGDYQSPVAVFDRAIQWAKKKGYEDIVASCEHYTGQIYFRAGRYGLAFEHLLKAHKSFNEIGYEKVPAASIYLYTLGLDYYRFEEYDKALDCFLSASRYPVYLPRAELNTLNSIGLIYARSKEWDKASAYYRKTIAKAAAYNDPVWVGIASGNLGNIFLSKGQNDSALFYHRINYHINISQLAPEDAAKTALSIATVFVRKRLQDSALYYIRSGEHLAHTYIVDSTEIMKYRKRMLMVMIDFYKLKGDYRSAVLLSDSLYIVTDSLQQKMDNKILNRAEEKVELEGYKTELALLESKKRLSQVQFYLLIATLLVIILVVSLIFKRYQVRKNYQMQLAEKEKQALSMDKLRANKELKDAEGRLAEYLTLLKENTLVIENLDSKLERLKQTANTSDLLAVAANMEKLVSSTILTDEDWRHFLMVFEQVHPGFVSQLKEKFSDLSPSETRLLILTKLNLSTREMANMLGVSVDAIRKSRYRLRKKLHLDKEMDFEMVVE